MKYLVFIFIFTACSSAHKENSYSKKYKSAIHMKKCEQAQEIIPLEKDDTQHIRFYQGAMGYMISIPIMSVTTVFDMIILSRCRYGCPSEDENKEIIEFLFPATTWTYESTKELRCPDNSYYINKFIEVASCYENRENKESLLKAQEQLAYLDKVYEDGPTCIQVRDSQVIKQQLKRIEKKLKI